MTLPKIESSVSEAEGQRLRSLALDATVLEIGSWRGFSTVTMATVASVVHAVDHHLGDAHAGHDESLRFLIDNLDRYDVRGSVVVHVGSSEQVLPLFRPDSFDLAFIDAFHETDAVALDAALVLPLVRSGGRVAFHDYGLFGVAEAVDNLDLIMEDLVGTLWIGRKP